MNKLGIAISSLGHSQLSYRIIKEVNDFMLKRYDIPISVFYQNLERPLGKLLTGYFNITESWLFAGTVIATNHSTASKLLTIIGPKRKIYYVQDLDFLNRTLDYSMFTNIFWNDNLDIICRAESHKKVIENNFNKKVLGVVDKFRLSELLPMVGIT